VNRRQSEPFKLYSFYDDSIYNQTFANVTRRKTRPYCTHIHTHYHTHTHTQLQSPVAHIQHNSALACSTVQVTLYRPPRAQRESRGIALLNLNLGIRREWVVSTTSRPLYPPGKTRYPSYRRLGGPHGPSLDPRTVQPTVSPYAD
jgi:hypothetical protein